MSKKRSRSRGNNASVGKLPQRNARCSWPVARATRKSSSRRPANTWRRGVAVPKRSIMAWSDAVCTPGGRNPLGNVAGKVMVQALRLPYSSCPSVSVCPPPAEPLLALHGPISYLREIDHRHVHHLPHVLGGGGVEIMGFALAEKRS